MISGRTDCLANDTKQAPSVASELNVRTTTLAGGITGSPMGPPTPNPRAGVRTKTRRAPVAARAGAFGTRRPNSNAVLLIGSSSRTNASSRSLLQITARKSKRHRALRSTQSSDPCPGTHESRIARLEPIRAGAMSCSLSQQLDQVSATRVAGDGIWPELHPPARVSETEAEISVPTGTDVVYEAPGLLECNAANRTISGLGVRTRHLQRVALVNQTPQPGIATCQRLALRLRGSDIPHGAAKHRRVASPAQRRDTG